MDVSRISEPQAPESSTSLLQRVFPVRRHEVLTVLLLAVNVFVLLSTYYLLKVVREPLIGDTGAEAEGAVAGAGLLVAGDTLSRVVLAPVELPVGPLMVVLGVPLFLWLLREAV